jgi:hypothetical protein
VATGSLARRVGIVLAVVLVALLAGSAAYSWITLHYEYSNGERAGVLQKFSHKGWVCKSYEGELALYVVAGVQPEVWNFTVRDPAIAQQLAKVVGQRVQLHYVEHRGIPTSCMGDTAYFVDRINETSAAPLGIGPIER